MTDKDLKIRGKSVAVWEFCRDMENCDCLEGRCPLEDLCNNNQIQDIEFDYSDEDDVKKIEDAYKIVMEEKEGEKWYSKEELMELLKTAERVPMRNFNPYNIKEMKFMLAKFCKEERECERCDSCVLLEPCLNIPAFYKDVVIETLVDWLLALDTNEGLELVEELFNKRMEEGVL